MKFLHLSDLHIGKRVNQISMLEDQDYILRQILEVVREQTLDAVVICGDVYDKTVPSAEAVALFDAFLVELARLVPQVMLISGNHDSPERLAFGGRLMQAQGVHVSPVYQGNVQPVVCQDGHGPVYFWLLPFLKPAQVKAVFPEAEIESYTDACQVAIDALGLDKSQRNVLLTHQFVTGSVTCDSEQLSVGGSDNVDAAVFEAFDYVALGHIHGPQNVGSEKIRYCGTPLKYSFSECSHRKSLTLVTLEEKGSLQVQTLPLTPLRDLQQLRGSYLELTSLAYYQELSTQNYFHITLTDEEDVPEAVARLRVIYPNLMKLSYDNTRTRQDAQAETVVDVEKKTPLQLFEELYQIQNNQPLSPVQRSYLHQLMTSIWEEAL